MSKNKDFEFYMSRLNASEVSAKTTYNRTYLPGYDLGDWLTLKSDDKLYSAIQITDITDDSGNMYRSEKEDLYMRFRKVEIAERPEVVTTKHFRPILMWNMLDNVISYTELLKEYRPLTANEKLLYIKE